MTTAREALRQTRRGLRHFVNNLGEYPATMHLVNDEELATLREASKILDRMEQRRESSVRSLNTDWAFTERQETEGQVALRPENRAVVTSWWETHDNISFLATWMADHGESAAAIAEMVETPWSFTEEYEVAQDWHLMELAGEQPFGSTEPTGFVQPTHPPRAENQRPTDRKDTP